jgi:hypothetical protein
MKSISRVKSAFAEHGIGARVVGFAKLIESMRAGQFSGGNNNSHDCKGHFDCKGVETCGETENKN